MSTFFVAMITILLDGMPPQRIPLASGLSNFARITAGGFAASISPRCGTGARRCIRAARAASGQAYLLAGFPVG
jgi:hypothetical protein